MSKLDVTTEAFANTRPSSAEALRDYAPIPRPALGPALNKPEYYAGRVERHLYWVTDGTYQSACLSTSDGDSGDGHTQTTMNRDLGVWTYKDCAPVLIDYQDEMFAAIRSETPADLVELNVRLLANTAQACDGMRPI